MNRTIAYCSLLVVGAFLATVSACRPVLMSDDNEFLKELVGANLLLVSGVILTITLASAGQIHLSLNEIESRHGEAFLHKTRAGVHSSAYCLIALFLAAVVTVTCKHYFDVPPWEAFFNSAALFILFWMVLIMTSLTRLIFAIKPHYPQDS
jgi:hypothetical protein